MTLPVIALITVTVGFIVLVTWLFWPGNRARFQDMGRVVLDEAPIGDNPVNTNKRDNT